MRRFSWPAVAAALIAATACAPTSEVSDLGEIPPLIDRELIFGDAKISGAQLSPDGKYMSFIKPYRDVRNIWVKGVDEPFEDARPITADERPVPGYFWSQDGKYVLYVQDKGGNEDFHVFAVDPDGERDPATEVPEARNLTPLDQVRALIYALPRERPDEIIIGLNDRKPAFHDVYTISISTGERKLLLQNDQSIASFGFDLDGQPRLAYRQTPTGGAQIMRIAGDALELVYECSAEESCFAGQFHPDGRRAYLTTNKGDDVDLSRLMLLDVETGETELIESDPKGEVDFGGSVFHPETRELLATVYVGDRIRIYPKTPEMQETYDFLKANLPDGDLGIQSTTRAFDKWLVTVTSDVDPGSVHFFDLKERTTELVYRSRPELPSEHLAHMKPIRYTARDGLTIPAYLTLPRGVEPKNLPVVVHPHGGPWARDIWGYNSFAQFLANRGYAVLQMNFRSSTGYGKKFLNAGNRTWGIGAMQHDITDGVQYLIDEGIADPERIGIFGGSYGGYATLAGVTFTPELYRCGVPYVAPSNIVTLINSFPAYWRPYLNGTWYKRVGDPDVETDVVDMEERSPLNHVDKIEAPLLVVHGANDPRVKQGESDRIVAALRDKGMDVEYIVAPDEGHGFRAPENREALAAAMERFLAKHLGGRFQEGMPERIAERLDQITVDVAGVNTGEPVGVGADVSGGGG